MSRRADTPVPEYQNARKALKRQKAAAPAEVLKQETAEPWPPPAEVLSHEATYIWLDELPRTPDPEPTRPPEPQRLGRFATKAELDAVMSKYTGNGVCPLCQVRIGRGIHGHVSKCLRLQNSSPESTTTS